jgi:hypothetical protein
MWKQYLNADNLKHKALDANNIASWRILGIKFLNSKTEKEKT